MNENTYNRLFNEEKIRGDYKTLLTNGSKMAVLPILLVGVQIVEYKGDTATFQVIISDSDMEVGNDCDDADLMGFKRAVDMEVMRSIKELIEKKENDYKAHIWEFGSGEQGVGT